MNTRYSQGRKDLCESPEDCQERTRVLRKSPFHAPDSTRRPEPREKACKQAYSKIFGPFWKIFMNGARDTGMDNWTRFDGLLGLKRTSWPKAAALRRPGHQFACLCCRSRRTSVQLRWEDHTDKAFAGRPRNYAEIVSKEDEFLERVWYERHMEWST